MPSTHALPSIPPRVPVPLGMNLTGAIYYGSCLAFRNLFKLSACSRAHGGGGPGRYQNIFPHDSPAVDAAGRVVPAPEFDADGYLANGNGRGQYDDQKVYCGVPTMPPGVYKLRAEGDGDWLLVGKMDGETQRIAGTFKGRLVTSIDLPHGMAEGQLQILRTEPGDHVRDVRLMMPGCDLDDDRYFTDEFIDSLKGFTTLRLMDFMETNGDAVVEWADRCLPTSQTYSDDNGLGGIPYETFGELAERTGADLWVNIPRRASDDWIAKFGALMLATLPPTTTLYVEYGNELWNGFTFQTALANQAEAVASGLYDPNISLFERANRYAARRCRQTSMLLRRPFGAEAGRVRDIFATMGAGTLDWGLDEWAHYGVDPGVTTRPAAPLDAPNAMPYAAAVSAYVGHDAFEGDHAAANKAGGVPAVLADVEGRALDAAERNWAGCRAVANQYGTKLLVYEGGFENFGQANINDLLAADISAAASHAPGIEALTTRVLCRVSRYFDGFMWFSHCSPPSKYGQYGVIESLYPAPATSPKFKALRIWQWAARAASAVRTRLAG